MHTIASYPSSAIVFVDSEQSVLAILHRLLRDLTDGYDLIPATTSDDALAQLAKRPVALMIIDAQPDRQNAALIRAIKSMAPTCQVLLLTHAGVQDHLSAHMAGADFCLSMPFPFTQFGRVVRAALTRSAPVLHA